MRAVLERVAAWCHWDVSAARLDLRGPSPRDWFLASANSELLIHQPGLRVFSNVSTHGASNVRLHLFQAGLCLLAVDLPAFAGDREPRLGYVWVFTPVARSGWRSIVHCARVADDLLRVTLESVHVDRTEWVMSRTQECDACLRLPQALPLRVTMVGGLTVVVA